MDINVDFIFNKARLMVAQNIRRIRNDQKLTQEDLAHRASLALRHLQKIEAAQVNVTLDTLVKLAVALNTELSEFFREPPQGGAS